MKTHPSLAYLVALVVFATVPGGCAPTEELIAEPTPDITAARLSNSLPLLTLGFEANVGQAPEDAKFVLRGKGHILVLKADGARMALRKPAETKKFNPATGALARVEPPSVKTTELELRWVGAARDPKVGGQRPVNTSVKYYKGASRADWIKNVPVYRDVRYVQLYPGIDLVFRVEAGRVRYAFHISPGAEPSLIRFSFKGAKVLRVDEIGDLVIDTPAGAVRHTGLRAYQEVNGGIIPVESRFELTDAMVGFHVAGWDPAKPLVIDPIVVFSGYAEGIADPSIAAGGGGIVYMAGSAMSPAAPDLDAYVAKFDLSNPGDPAAGVPLNVTYIGGTRHESPGDVALFNNNRVYVTGSTASTEGDGFPLVDAPQPNNAGSYDVFVASFDDTLALTFSSFYGGAGLDSGRGIAVDDDGAIYVTGSTYSPTLPGGLVRGWSAVSDAFVVKFGPELSNIGFVTYLGGESLDTARDIAVHKKGVFVVGYTYSFDYPTRYPVQSCLNQAQPSEGECPDHSPFTKRDAFLTQLDRESGQILFSTYLGGSNSDEGHAVAVDDDGAVYLTGWTYSAEPTVFPTTFPTTDGAYQMDSHGMSAFVTKIETFEGGSSVKYSTLLKGNDFGNNFWGLGIAVDGMKRAWVVGAADAPIAFGSLPPFTNVYTGGAYDGFVTRLNANGSDIELWAPVGGINRDYVGDMALFLDDLYLVGHTGSGTDFYTTPSSMPNVELWSDFLVKIDLDAAPPGFILAVEKSHIPEPVGVGGTLNFDITVTNQGPLPAMNVRLIDIAFPDKTFDFRYPSASQGSCSRYRRNIIICVLGDLLPGISAQVSYSSVDFYPVHSSVEYKNTVLVLADGMSLSDIVVFEEPVTVVVP